MTQLVGMKVVLPNNDDNRYSVFTSMFKAETPAVIVARGLEVPEGCFEPLRKMA